MTLGRSKLGPLTLGSGVALPVVVAALALAIASAPAGAQSTPTPSASPVTGGGKSHSATAGAAASARPASASARSGSPAGNAPSPAARKVAASALARLADRIASELREPAANVPAFVGPLRSDEPAPRGAELALRMGSLLAGTMGLPTSAQAEPVTLATAHALARKARGFVYMQPEIAHGEVRVSADLFLVVRNVWDRVRQLAPAPVAHSFASEHVDAEVRGYLNPVPPLSGTVKRIPMEDRDVLALECADADEDGVFEVVTLGRHRAAIGRLRDGKYVPVRVATLRELVEIAAVPLREPFASAVFVHRQGAQPGYLDVGSTDRAHGLRFDADLRPLERLSGVPVHAGLFDQCVRFDGTVFNASMAPCVRDDAPLRPVAALPSAFDAVFEAAIVARDGTAHRVRATHNPFTNELELDADARGEAATKPPGTSSASPMAAAAGGAGAGASAGGAMHAVVPHAGAQVAVADLDGDGVAEIVSTLDSLAAPAPGSSAMRSESRGAEADALVVSSWELGSAPQERVRVPVPGGVRAVAVCPPEGPTPAPVLLVTSGELWIVR